MKCLNNDCLDFSLFSGWHEIERGGPWTIDNTPLVFFLKFHPEITRIDISNHPEVDNLLFSRFRKHLPNLVELYAKDTYIEVTGRQMLKYLANNIKLTLVGRSRNCFHDKVLAYVEDHSYLYSEEKQILADLEIKIDYPFVTHDQLNTIREIARQRFSEYLVRIISEFFLVPEDCEKIIKIQDECDKRFLNRSIEQFHQSGTITKVSANPESSITT